MIISFILALFLLVFPPEGGPLDDFNRADAPFDDPPWLAWYGNGEVVSNEAHAYEFGGSNLSALHYDESYSDSFYSRVGMGSVSDSPNFRCAFVGTYGATLDGYAMCEDGTGSESGVGIWTLEDGLPGAPFAYTPLTYTLGVGDALAIAIDGDQVLGYVYSGSSWSDPLVITDTGVRSANMYPGIFIEGNVATLDDFYGGALSESGLVDLDAFYTAVVDVAGGSSGDTVFLLVFVVLVVSFVASAVRG